MMPSFNSTVSYLQFKIISQEITYLKCRNLHVKTCKDVLLLFKHVLDFTID